MQITKQILPPVKPVLEITIVFTEEEAVLLEGGIGKVNAYRLEAAGMSSDEAEMLLRLFYELTDTLHPSE
jgi:hypothetical protein